MSRGELRESFQMSNVDRLLSALQRWPGITEIALADFFSPGDFFTLSEYSRKGLSGPMFWTYRIAEVILTAKARGLIRCVPTSHPDYTSYFAAEEGS